MHELVDLRSDTVTRPTAAMRRAMAEAPVGDDVYDEDPSVNRLQEMAAERMGKEAALFVASGTMGNAAAIKAHTRSGDEILLDPEAHSMLYEVGMPAVIAQVLTRQFHSVGGVPDVAHIRQQIHTESLHGAATTLIVLENSHNRAGGAIIPIENHRQLWDLAQERGIAIHLDGARLFNTAVATGIPTAEYTACVDTVTFCLSKVWAALSARCCAVRRSLSRGPVVCAKCLAEACGRAGFWLLRGSTPSTTTSGDSRTTMLMHASWPRESLQRPASDSKPLNLRRIWSTSRPGFRPTSSKRG